MSEVDMKRLDYMGEENMWEGIWTSDRTRVMEKEN
jgi:hypothetical protein